MVLVVLAWFAAQYDLGTGGKAWPLAGLFIVGAVIIPFAILGWWVHRGFITDMHMPERRERFWPLLLELGCTFLVWIVLQLIGSFPGINLVTVFLFFETLIGLCVTVYWQISVHSGIITGAVVIAGILFGAQTALILSPLVLLVAAARLHLKRHTVGQIAAGIAVGISVPLVYWLIAAH
ncbi:MAG: hypothetical protein ABI690_22235 [Chloroflexota bacterium]